MASSYKGLSFRTALEAQWAAFFDLAGWSWHSNPAAIDDWAPDFRVTFPCQHSECGGYHALAVAVLAVEDVGTVKGHPAFEYAYGGRLGQSSDEATYDLDAGAVFGANPAVTQWEMSHGSGGGTEAVDRWVDNWKSLWLKASEALSS